MTVGRSVWPRAAETVRRQEPRPSNLRGTVWIVTYLLFILAPLFALLLGSHPPARSFWTEFSVALGYSGLAMMGLQLRPSRILR